MTGPEQPSRGGDPTASWRRTLLLQLARDLESDPSPTKRRQALALVGTITDPALADLVARIRRAAGVARDDPDIEEADSENVSASNDDGGSGAPE